MSWDKAQIAHSTQHTSNSKNQTTSKTLKQASENSHETVMRLLINVGADVNARDQNGRTPLLYASQNVHVALVIGSVCFSL